MFPSALPESFGYPAAGADDPLIDSPRCPEQEPSIHTSRVVATEAVVREAVREQALAQGDDPSEAIFEFWVPLSNERADVVVVERDMAGYEIKTERDTLRRLPRQAAAYGRLFDRCTIVTAERHLDAALGLVPEWWGVISYVNGHRPLTLREVRAAVPNGSIDPETLVRLLWREEVRAALASIGSDPDPRSSRASMWQHLLDLIDLSRLGEIVRAAILGRDAQAARLPTRRFSTSDVSS